MENIFLCSKGDIWCVDIKVIENLKPKGIESAAIKEALL